MTDPASRTTRFGYEVVTATGGQTVSLLTTITDTRGQVWEYAYTPLVSSTLPIFLLAQITDPDGRGVEATGFDSLGRAITQTYRGESLSLVYHEDGRRVITDGLGRVMTHTYNSQYLLVGTTDALGQGETFVLDAAYNRTFSQDKNGQVTRYARTELGLTTAITDALGQVTRYEYDGRNNLTKTTDARNKVTTYLHDTQAQNNLISTTNHLGDSMLYTYNARGQVTSVTDENGQTTTYDYDALGQRTVITDALGQATHYAYDSLGRVVTTTDVLGKVTVNEYDGADNLVKVIENYQAGQPQNDQQEFNLVTQYAFDGAGRQTVVTDTLGRVTRHEYDPVGRLAQTIQNVHPTVSTQNYLNESNLVTEYEYDAAGNPVAVIDTLGRETRTEYDELNRAERTIVNYVDGVYSAAQPDEDISTGYGYDDNGNLVSTIDVLGRETRTEYDDLNRVERTIVNYVNGAYSALQPDEDLITAYTYDEVGNQVTLSDPLGRLTTYTYDDLNRVATITNPLSGTTTYSYDPAGNRIELTDAENRSTGYEYDGLNRVVTTTNALGGQTVVSFDEVGNRVSLTDANGHTTTFEYDSLYRLVETTDAENQTTTMTYDALGNRLSQTDPESKTTTYDYDTLNRLIETTNPLSGTTHTTYDALGNRLSTTDANNHSTSYTYDDLYRLVTTTDPNNLVTTITYDGLGNRLSLTNGANETTEFEYDQANRLILVRDDLGQETQYRYDGVGNQVAVIDAEGVETRSGYDPLNRLSSVIENYADGVYSPNQTDQDVRTVYSYDAVGNRTGVTDARTYTTLYDYDDLNRLIQTADPLSHTTHYGYDAVGNRTVMTDANQVVTVFTYDDVNRLTGITYPSGTPDVTFTYDKAGNRKTMSDGTGTTSYTYDDLYRLTEITDGANKTVGYRHDAVGNRTNLIYPNGQVVTYTYDLGNRLETVEDWNNGQFGYNYDNANRLTELSRPNGITSSLTYDEAGRLTLLTHETVTQTLASYVYQLDRVGHRLALTETLVTPLDIPLGAYLESDGLAVAEAENFSQVISSPTHTWLTSTLQGGYTGTAYLQALPDIDLLNQTGEVTAGPVAQYPIQFTTPGTYTLWSRGSASNAAGDSFYVDLNGQLVSVTGFEPEEWTWANEQLPTGEPAHLTILTGGLYTLSLRLREDGLRLDRLLLTTDTTYIPSGVGPSETARQTEVVTQATTTVTRTITYSYDGRYRLAGADYSTGEAFGYSYDAVGNRVGLVETSLLSGTLVTTSTFDAADRLAERVVSDGRVYSYTWSERGELLAEVIGGYPVRTFSYDAAGRMAEATVFTLTTTFRYNGDGARLAVTVAGQDTTTYTLDYAGDWRILEELTATETKRYLYGQATGLCLGEETAAGWSYYLPDAEGQVRQLADEAGTISSVWLYDPEGTVLEGPEGLVSHLVCGGVYDWSTGLIYQDGQYFDPALGIWLVLMPLAVIQGWSGRKQKQRNVPWYGVFLMVICIGGLVTACSGVGTPLQELCTEGTPVGGTLGDNALFLDPGCCNLPSTWRHK